jgi:hypothetical protein
MKPPTTPTFPVNLTAFTSEFITRFGTSCPPGGVALITNALATAICPLAAGGLKDLFNLAPLILYDRSGSELRNGHREE